MEIVVAYRRLYEWLPSKYNQMMRPSKTKRIAAAWPGQSVNRYAVGQDVLPFDLENRGDFTDLVHDIETTGRHPTDTVLKKYQPFFETIHVVDLHNLEYVVEADHGGGDAYLQHLFCSVLKTPHTCGAAVAGEIGKNKTNSNVSPSLDYEMLAVHAYQQGLLAVSRQLVVSAIQRRQEQLLSLTASSFPQQCLSSQILDRLIDLSVRVDANLFGSSVEREAQQRRGFVKLVNARDKYCHMDVAKVLPDKGWRNMLMSLRHGHSSQTRRFGSQLLQLQLETEPGRVLPL